MFSKTVSSRDAATEPAGMHSRRVSLNMCVSCTVSAEILFRVRRARYLGASTLLRRCFSSRQLPRSYSELTECPPSTVITLPVM